MPSLDPVARAAIITQLDGLGYSGASIIDDIGTAIYAAGYEVQPSGGGSPVGIIDTVTATRTAIVGAMGTSILSFSVGGVPMNIFEDARGGAVVRAPIGGGGGGGSSGATVVTSDPSGSAGDFDGQIKLDRTTMWLYVWDQTGSQWALWKNDGTMSV